MSFLVFSSKSRLTPCYSRPPQPIFVVEVPVWHGSDRLGEFLSPFHGIANETCSAGPMSAYAAPPGQPMTTSNTGQNSYYATGGSYPSAAAGPVPAGQAAAGGGNTSSSMTYAAPQMAAASTSPPLLPFASSQAQAYNAILSGTSAGPPPRIAPPASAAMSSAPPPPSQPAQPQQMQQVAQPVKPIFPTTTTTTSTSTTAGLQPQQQASGGQSPSVSPGSSSAASGSPLYYVPLPPPRADGSNAVAPGSANYVPPLPGTTSTAANIERTFPTGTSYSDTDSASSLQAPVGAKGTPNTEDPFNVFSRTMVNRVTENTHRRAQAILASFCFDILALGFIMSSIMGTVTWNKTLAWISYVGATYDKRGNVDVYTGIWGQCIYPNNAGSGLNPICQLYFEDEWAWRQFGKAYMFSMPILTMVRVRGGDEHGWSDLAG